MEGLLKCALQLDNLPLWIAHLYLFLAALDLGCFAQALSSPGEQRLLFAEVCGLRIVAASPVAEHRL